jgi:PAS domain S-box-containing protein
MFLPLRGFPGAGLAIATTLGVFVVAGACAAFLARWRERTEAELRDSRDRFRMLANSAPALIWMADASGRCTYFNDAWLEFTGLTPDQALAAGWLASVHEDDRERCALRYRTALAERQPLSLDYRRRRWDGSYRTVFDRSQARFDEQGTFLGMIGSCVDITEQRQALDRSDRALAHAEQANRAKDAFLAVVSHELRTPLSPISAWGRMLQGGNLDATQTSRAVEVIVRSAHAGTAGRGPARRVAHRRGQAAPEGCGRSRSRPSSDASERCARRPTRRGFASAYIDSVAPMVADPDRLQRVLWNLSRRRQVRRTAARGGLERELARGSRW